MSKTKIFGHNKAHAINYLNVIKKNNKIDFCILAFAKGGWTVFYDYKK